MFFLGFCQSLRGQRDGGTAGLERKNVFFWDSVRASGDSGTAGRQVLRGKMVFGFSIVFILIIFIYNYFLMK